MDQLVQQQVDVILAGGSTGAQAARDATSAIPIDAAGSADLVELGLVRSLSRPGGNLTGFVTVAPETAAKRLQIMTEIMPHAKLAAVLWNPGSSNAEAEWKAVENSASGVGLAVAPYQVRRSQDLDNTLTEIARCPLCGIGVP